MRLLANVPPGPLWLGLFGLQQCRPLLCNLAGGLTAADALLFPFAGFAPLVLHLYAVQGPALKG